MALCDKRSPKMDARYDKRIESCSGQFVCRIRFVSVVAGNNCSLCSEDEESERWEILAWAKNETRRHRHEHASTGAGRWRRCPGQWVDLEAAFLVLFALPHSGRQK